MKMGEKPDGLDAKGNAFPKPRKGAEKGEDQICRVCFEEGKEDDPVLSPCDCNGTQKWIHLSCLRKWQDVVLSSSVVLDARARICSVCNSPFSVAPKPVKFLTRAWLLAEVIWRLILRAIVIFSVSQILLVHVGIVIVLLLHSSIVRAGMSTACLLLGAFFVGQHLSGVRFILQRSGESNRGMRIALIRCGPKVEGLKAGCLLVAAQDLEGGLFEKAVVFIYEHSQHGGACGVILNKCLDNTQNPPSVNFWDSNEVRSDAMNGLGRVNGEVSGDATGLLALPLAHYIGGPVGLEAILAYNDGGKEVVSLHRHSNVCGSREVQVSHQGEGNETMNASVHAACGPSQLRNLFQYVADNNEESSRIHLYHGKAAWAKGQLEGEIRDKFWGFCQANVSDIFEVQPSQMWDTLVRSNRCVWMNDS